MNKTVQSILAIITLVSTAFGVYFYVDNKYALANDLEKVKQRLEYKIVSDHVQSIQDRIWKIEDRFQKKKMDDTTKEEYRKLQADKEEAQAKLKKIEKKDGE